jgi:hypothetical protein
MNNPVILGNKTMRVGGKQRVTGPTKATRDAKKTYPHFITKTKPLLIQGTHTGNSRLKCAPNFSLREGKVY